MGPVGYLMFAVMGALSAFTGDIYSDTQSFSLIFRGQSCLICSDLCANLQTRDAFLYGQTFRLDLKLVRLSGGVDLQLLLLNSDFTGLKGQFLLLHLDDGVLSGLLRLLLRRLILVCLKDLLGSGSGQTRNLQFSVLFHLRVRGRVRNTGSILDLFAVLEAHMLHDVSLHRRHHALCLRVLPHKLSDLRVLQRRGMHRYVRIMVLWEERFDRFAVENVDILTNRIDRLLLVSIHRHKFVRVLNTENLQHLPVQVGEVVNLRSALGHLHDGLVLHNLLGHSGGVRVADGDNGNKVVVALLGLRSAFLGLVRVLVGGVVADDILKKPELLLHRVVDARLNGRHHLQSTFEDGEGRANRRISRHIRHLEVCSARKTPPFVHDGAEEGVQDLARLLIRERHQVIADRTAGYVYVAPFGGGYRGVIALDTKSLSLESTR